MHYNFQEFAYWQGRNYGLAEYMSMGAQFTWPFSYDDPTLDPQTYQTAYICMGQYYNRADFPEYCNTAASNSYYAPPEVI